MNMEVERVMLAESRTRSELVREALRAYIAKQVNTDVKSSVN